MRKSALIPRLVSSLQQESLAAQNNRKSGRDGLSDRAGNHTLPITTDRHRDGKIYVPSIWEPTYC